MLGVPCSLTLDKDFAYTFSSDTDTGGGIMVELNHGTLSSALCLDSSSLSEFPMKDIVMRGLKIFRFWYMLKEGFCAMRTNMMLAEATAGTQGGHAQSSKYVERIPLSTLPLRVWGEAQ